MKNHFANSLPRSDSAGILLSLLAVASILSGCGRAPSNGSLLARAGGKELYMAQVSAHVDTNSAYAVRNYVSNWVDQQLLLDEAEKEGLNDNDRFRQRVDEFSRQLAVTMLLNKRIYQAADSFSAQTLVDYYSLHQEEFRASENVALVNFVSFGKRSVSVSFRNSIVSGQAWNLALSHMPPYEIMMVSDSTYLKRSGTNQSIWTVIQSLSEGAVSFPIQLDSLTYIVQVLKWYDSGQLLPISCVAPEIKQKLTIEKRTKLYNNLIDSLRASGNFEINPGVAIRDTGTQE